ncbi:MAG: hypothetical protein KME30_11715 [Iphinoe sp. HA4291-MV1]|nr:hypothetical protein [Iphinoe sp. HA4291-MV1]
MGNGQFPIPNSQFPMPNSHCHSSPRRKISSSVHPLSGLLISIKRQ